jgi:hypothetical protein
MQLYTQHELPGGCKFLPLPEAAAAPGYYICPANFRTPSLIIAVIIPVQKGEVKTITVICPPHPLKRKNQ